MRSKFLAQTLVLAILASTLTGCAPFKRWWHKHFGPKDQAALAPLPEGGGIGMSERGPIGEKDYRTFAAQVVHFEYDSAKIKPSEFSKIEAVAAALKGNNKNLIVEGHTDERGTAEYNRALGERRAQAAREELIRLGVAASRITTISYGKDRPIEPLHNETAWSANRRAEFVVVSQ
jgi:peptidoglycan-associated lipoprotein